MNRYDPNNGIPGMMELHEDGSYVRLDDHLRHIAELKQIINALKHALYRIASLAKVTAESEKGE